MLKLKVIHLIRRLERIERDLEELDQLQTSLHMDREYSRKLKESLLEESVRLKDLRDSILSQRIQDHSQGEVQSDETGSESEEENTAKPDSVQKDTVKKQSKKPVVSATTGQNASEKNKAQKEPAAAQSSGNKKPRTFQFKFQQES